MISSDILGSIIVFILAYGFYLWYKRQLLDPGEVL